jgi:hypothetical protein
MHATLFDMPDHSSLLLICFFCDLDQDLIRISSIRKLDDPGIPEKFQKDFDWNCFRN